MVLRAAVWRDPHRSKAITALRSAVAGEVAEADGISATQVALRQVFDGFTLQH